MKKHGLSKINRIFIKIEMMKRDGSKCFWCSKPLTYQAWTFDHIIPKSKGGLYRADNGVSSCEKCNNRRGDKPADEYLKARLIGRA